MTFCSLYAMASSVHTHGKMKSFCFLHQKWEWKRWQTGKNMFNVVWRQDLYSSSARTKTNEIALFCMDFSYKTCISVTFRGNDRLNGFVTSVVQYDQSFLSSVNFLKTKNHTQMIRHSFYILYSWSWSCYLFMTCILKNRHCTC